MTARLSAIGGILAFALSGALAAPSAAPPPIPRPDTEAGSYQVTVDRVLQSRMRSTRFSGDGQRGGTQQMLRRIQLQLSVRSRDAAAVPGLAAFNITGIQARTGGKLVPLAHTGGPLEAPADVALARAYLYLNAVPHDVDELHSIRGELVAYEKAGDVEIRIPATRGLPTTVIQSGITAVLKTYTIDSQTAQLTLDLAPPEGLTLIDSATDGTHGVTLTTKDRRTPANAGGTFTQVRERGAEYAMTFLGVRSEPSEVSVRVFYRGGKRRVLPFRIDRIPLPVRAE